MFFSSLLDYRFELSLGLNFYPLKVLILDRENDFCYTLFDYGNLAVNIGIGSHYSNNRKF